MKDIAAALDLPVEFETLGTDYLPSCFAVTDLAARSIGAVGNALADLMVRLNLSDMPPAVVVDRRLASLWFGWSIKPVGWDMPPVWDAIAGDYQTRDGWIKLHTNLPHHRAAAISVLGARADREEVKAAVRAWDKDALEIAIVSAGGVAAAMRGADVWAAHPQGRAVADEPLIAWDCVRSNSNAQWPAGDNANKSRPLAGVKVLDLTRVLAGPVATRTLAGYGADVLRIDPPDWEEANVVPDITLGKRCARLDLTASDDRSQFENLLAEADILVHGYRPDALEGLGLGDAARRKIAPEIIDISLDAYGWSGPWAGRRGFDSLVQMSSGIADAGMHWANATKPTPLPVQALDHATGYLMAAAAIRALAARVSDGEVRRARLSLARTAALLIAHPQDRPDASLFDAMSTDYNEVQEQTPWGPALRLKPAVTVKGTPMQWARPACDLGDDAATWGYPKDSH